MYIEDILKAAIQHFSINFSLIDQKVLFSLYSQVSQGTAFTEKQANLCVSLLKKYKNKLSLHLNTNIPDFLENPNFHQEFRVIANERKMKIVDHQTYTKAIRIDFPYSDDLINKFRENKKSLNYATWDKDEKCWFLSLDEKSIRFAIALVEENNFTYDDQLEIFMHQANHVKNNIESLVPMAIDDNGVVKFINISPYTPQNTATDFLESILFAKEVGISTWDQTIEERVDQLPYEKVVKNFIKHDIGTPFEVHLEETSLFDLLPVLKHLFPCLVIISTKDELQKLEKIIQVFQKLQVDNSEISVLFRLPSETDSNFNQYVKENKFNSPISEKTKVAVISNQIPKTIFSSNKEFNSILNYNFFAVHYKLRDYVRNHKNVINILDKAPQRSFNFAIMQSSN